MRTGAFRRCCAGATTLLLCVPAHNRRVWGTHARSGLTRGAGERCNRCRCWWWRCQGWRRCLRALTLPRPAAQVPMLYLTEYLKRKVRSDQIGNFIFWISFCIIGQPISIILYYHNWLLINRPEWCARPLAPPPRPGGRKPATVLACKRRSPMSAWGASLCALQGQQGRRRRGLPAAVLSARTWLPCVLFPCLDAKGPAASRLWFSRAWLAQCACSSAACDMQSTTRMYAQSCCKATRACPRWHGLRKIFNNSCIESARST